MLLEVLDAILAQPLLWVTNQPAQEEESGLLTFFPELELESLFLSLLH